MSFQLSSRGSCRNEVVDGPKSVARVQSRVHLFRGDFYELRSGDLAGKTFAVFYGMQGIHAVDEH